MSAALFLLWQASLRPHGNGHEPGRGGPGGGGPYHCAGGGGACSPPGAVGESRPEGTEGDARVPPRGWQPASPRPLSARLRWPWSSQCPNHDGHGPLNNPTSYSLLSASAERAVVPSVHRVGHGPLSAPTTYGLLNASTEMAALPSVPQPRWPRSPQQSK